MNVGDGPVEPILVHQQCSAWNHGVFGCSGPFSCMVLLFVTAVVIMFTRLLAKKLPAAGSDAGGADWDVLRAFAAVNVFP